MTDPSRRPMFPVWAWVVAAALAVVTGYSIRQMGIQTAQMAELRREVKLATLQNQALQDQLELGRLVAAIMISPDSKPLRLAPSDKRMPVVRAYLHPSLGMAITADDMPAMASGRTWQLWSLPKKGQPLSLAIFRPDARGRVELVVPVKAPIEQIAAFTISEEPAGGSPQPTSEPLWAAQLK